MAQYQKINFIDYKSISDWSILSQYVQSIQGIKFTYIELKQFLKRRKEDVVIKDDILYSRVTIKINNGGVYLRDKKLGKDIGTKNQYLIRKGQLLLSKIDARNGAFGVVPSELDGAIITGNFWVFDINRSIILPELLALVLSSKRFQNIWNSCSNGTTNRHYLQEKAFLNAKIPVPTIKEQQRMVDEYQCKISEVDNINSEYITIDNCIKRKLSIENLSCQSANSKILNFIEFANLSNWDIKNRSSQNILASKQFKMIPLSQVAKINPSIKINLPNDAEISFVPMECVSDFDGEVIEYRVIAKDTKGYTKFQDGDIIWAKITPCMQNGKSAIVQGMINGIGYGSTEFHVIRVNNNLALTKYIYYILRMLDVRNEAKQYFTGSAGQQRVNASYLNNLMLPLPSLEVQAHLVKELDELKFGIQQNKQRQIILLKQAKQEFEEAIFG